MPHSYSHAHAHALDAIAALLLIMAKKLALPFLKTMRAYYLYVSLFYLFFFLCLFYLLSFFHRRKLLTLALHTNLWILSWRVSKPRAVLIPSRSCFVFQPKISNVRSMQVLTEMESHLTLLLFPCLSLHSFVLMQAYACTLFKQLCVSPI